MSEVLVSEPGVTTIVLTDAQAAFVQSQIAIAHAEVAKANTRAELRMKTFMVNVVKVPRGASYRIVGDAAGVAVEYIESPLKVMP